MPDPVAYPSDYECTPTCWRWIGRSNEAACPAWIYVAHSSELDTGELGQKQIDEEYIYEGNTETVLVVKIGKAEGCLECRRLELNGVLSPRLRERRRRGLHVEQVQPWCGAGGWTMWGCCRVEDLPADANARKSHVKSREREHQARFTRLDVTHLNTRNGEIYHVLVDESVTGELSELREIHDGYSLGDEEHEDHSEEAYRQYDIGLARFVCNLLGMQASPELTYSPQVQKCLRNPSPWLRYDLNFDLAGRSRVDGDFDEVTRERGQVIVTMLGEMVLLMPDPCA